MKKLLSIILFLLLLGACGGIGTETGNPEQPQANQSEPAETDDAYEGYGIKFEVPDNWVTVDSSENSAPTAASEDDDSENQTGSTTSIAFSSTGGDDETASVVTVYIIELEETPKSLKDYLDSERPNDIFQSYYNYYQTGFICENLNPGENGGDLKEIYFLKNNTLLYVVAELFEGSGSTEAEIILSTIRFTE